MYTVTQTDGARCLITYSVWCCCHSHKQALLDGNRDWLQKGCCWNAKRVFVYDAASSIQKMKSVEVHLAQTFASHYFSDLLKKKVNTPFMYFDVLFPRHINSRCCEIIIRKEVAARELFHWHFRRPLFFLLLLPKTSFLQTFRKFQLSALVRGNPCLAPFSCCFLPPPLRAALQFGSRTTEYSATIEINCLPLRAHILKLYYFWKGTQDKTFRRLSRLTAQIYLFYYFINMLD